MTEETERYIPPRFRTKSKSLFVRGAYNPKIKSDRSLLVIECSDWRKRLKRKGYKSPSDLFNVGISYKLSNAIFKQSTCRASVMNIRKLNQATEVSRESFCTKNAIDFDTFQELDKASNQ
tara:strand:- start:1441 stop:1800 length:360 start_codon:yes stop_codon:yes gene_type:complete